MPIRKGKRPSSLPALLAATRQRIGGFERTGRAAYLLDEAALADAAALLDMVGSAGGRPVSGEVLGTVALLYLRRFELLGPVLGAPDLAAAIETFVRGGADTADGAPPQLRPAVIALTGGLDGADPEATDETGRLAVDLCQLGEAAEEPRLLELGIAVLDVLVSSASEASVRAMQLSNLGSALRSWFEQTGSDASLDRAIAALREAVSLTPDGAAPRGLFLSNLGISLRSRFERGGRLTDLDAAVDVLRDAVASTPADASTRAGILSNFGNAARCRFELLGRFQDLDDAVDGHRQAAGLGAAEDPRRSVYLANLANTLRVRFGRDRGMSDLVAAIDLTRQVMQVIALTTPDDRFQRRYLNNLGIMLETRFEEAGDSSDLDEAVAVLSDVVDRTPADDPHRGLYLSNLGNALRVQYAQEGLSADLDRTIAVCRQALEAMPADYFDRAGCLSNLAGALQSRFNRTGQRDDLASAVEALTEAVRLVPLELPQGGKFLANLGNALRVQFSRTDDAEAGARALRMFRAVAEAGAAPVVQRIICARWWAELATALDRSAEALAGYAAAIELLPLVAWQGLAYPDRLRALESVTGLAADAAAVALAAGDVDRAVQFLEQSRGVLFAQTNEARSFLADLDVAAPDLAPRMREIRRELDVPEPAGSSALAAAPLAAYPVEDWGRHRRALGEEWDRLLSEARRRPGLDDVLRPPQSGDPRLAAAQGPVVIVNVSQYRCDAIIVTRDRVRAIPLPGLSRAATLQQLDALTTALDPDGDPAGQVLPAVLEWLWDVVVQPVLAALNITTPAPVGQDTPRVWWCPTGELSFLPLHAAGIHPPAGAPGARHHESLLDLTVPSFTPTLQALTTARETGSDPTLPDRALIVGLAKTPTLPSLPKVTSEVALLERLTGGTVLRNEQATKERVLAELATRPWLHFAGHGSQDQRSSATAALYCHDHVHAGPVSVGDIVRVTAGHARLAFLSACETARGTVRLPDEAVHIAGALQAAGFQHVIATQWFLADSLAHAVADHFYRQLLTSDGSIRRLDASGAAPALRATIRHLRDTRRVPPAYWASYHPCRPMTGGLRPSPTSHVRILLEQNPFGAKGSVPDHIAVVVHDWSVQVSR